MARTKKSVDTQPQVTNKNSNPNSIGYSATVNVKVMSGKKVLSSRTYKNNGTQFLFDFLGKCIIGDVNQVNSKRPKYLKIFQAGAINTPTPTAISEIKSKMDINNICTLSSIIYNDTPSVETTMGTGEVGNEDDKCDITFKFLIPYAVITTGTQASPKYTNLIALYNDENVNSLQQPSAYFLVTIPDPQDATRTLLSTLTTPGSNNDYTLYIEWKMTIQNR